MAEPPAAARIPLLLQQHLHIVLGSSRSAGPNCHCAGPWKLSVAVKLRVNSVLTSRSWCNLQLMHAF
jgi:hypothetical protein